MLVETKDISYAYTEHKTLVFPDITCRHGESVLIEGVSGSGKTTLLHILAGIMAPKTGSVSIHGHNITLLGSAAMDTFRGKHIGMVFQQHFFLQGLHVMENLFAAQRLTGLPPDKEYIEQLMLSLDIAHLKTEKPENISQGEQQRFSIARALVNRPWMVLADEPTSSLDDINCDRFLQLIGAVQQETNTTWIIATHDQRVKSHFHHIYTL